VRQRHCREAPPIAAGDFHSLFINPAGRLLACGQGGAVGHGDAESPYSDPIPVTAMAGVRVRSVAAGSYHSLALGWVGQVYSWGHNISDELDTGDIENAFSSPVLVQGLESVCGIAAASVHSLAVTQSGRAFTWGRNREPVMEASDEFVPIIVEGFAGCARAPRGRRRQYKRRNREPVMEASDEFVPIIVEGFAGVRVRRVVAGDNINFAIGADGKLFSWGDGEHWLLGHGDEQNQPSPKRVEELQAVRVSSVAVGSWHVLALTEDGRVYARGENRQRALLGDPHVERELLPKTVEALRGVRVGSIAAGIRGSYAVADTGEVWAWGRSWRGPSGLGHGDGRNCPLPKPIKSLRGIKVDAMAAGEGHALALAGDRRVHVWGTNNAAATGALGLGPAVTEACRAVRTPQRVPLLRVGM
jgi:alpha-tubulin suppressor-like RCC1 family protein